MSMMAGSWMFGLLLLAGGGIGVPLGVPPLPADPVLAQVAPGDCLFYFSSAGTARPDARSSNHTERLLAEPEVHHLVTEVEKLIRARLKESARNQEAAVRALAEEGPTLLKVLLTRPLTVYVPQLKAVPRSPREVAAGAVISLGDESEHVKAALDRCVSALVPGKAREITVEGTTFMQVPLGPDGPEITWGVKDKYLYVAAGEGELEALLKRRGGSAPGWLTTLHKQLPVERVSTVSMVNVQALVELLAPLGGPQVSRVLEALGVNGIDRLEGVSGLDKDGYVSRSLIALRGEPRGVVQLFDQKPLTAADLDLIPRDATFALAWKLDPAKAWTTVLATVEAIDPKAKEQLTKGSPAEQELRDEILQALGDTWCLFDSPGGGGMFVGVTAVVSLKDADAAASVEKKLIRLTESAAERAGPGNRPWAEKFTFAGKTVHVFHPGREIPLAPAWCRTDRHLVVALYPEAVKAFLGRPRRFEGLSKADRVGTALAGDGQNLALSYVNTRRLFDLVYPFFPVAFHAAAMGLRHEGVELPAGLMPTAGSIRRHLQPSVSVVRRTPAGIETVSYQTLPGNLGASTMPVLVGLLVPAVQKVREAAQRVSSTNNMKQIGIAMHNYADTYRGTFPPAYRVGKDGKPLLSWRVLILPYLEQQALYNEFHLDEPWDSPHNMKLMERMPKIYRSPASGARPGMTNYLTVRGRDTAFTGAKGVGFAEITDGLSYTIMVVEASDRKAVPWTKPDDFPYDERNPLDGLVGLTAGGFNALFCDGSVRFISAAVDPKVLRYMFLRNDGNAALPDQ
jgi:prepilin-type processing-associated H-X9-DG protein